jgi:hypothetical protein
MTARERAQSWFSVAEAGEIMGVDRSTAYRRFVALGARVGKQVLVARAHSGRTKLVVSAADIARVSGPDKQLADLLELREGFETLTDKFMELSRRVDAIGRKLGV